MVSSMTGFGRSDITYGESRITVEIRSVNNRYLDLNIRIPRFLGALEAEVRTMVKDRIRRGKVDIFISLPEEGNKGARVVYNPEIADQYLQALQSMAEEFRMENDMRLSMLARFPDVFTTVDEEPDEESLRDGVLHAVELALDQFCLAREREGAFLQRDLLEKLEEMRADVDYIEERSPEIIEAYKQGLREKIRDLLGDTQIDENRIMTEVTLYADKVCVDEEMVRLKSHIEAVKDLVEKGDDKEGIGRRLDFLAQEMNREANTTLSKSADLSVSDRGISLKTCIEKIREQIQNLE
ncbi:MAG: YicC family protein [Lachnospiraceae bacterium]|nr:YicC family protein [Lachnospiraceae bacterium]